MKYIYELKIKMIDKEGKETEIKQGGDGQSRTTKSILSSIRKDINNFLKETEQKITES